MQASINRCLSQARINWEGYAAGRASGIIWGAGGEGTVSSVKVASARTVGASVSIIFPWRGYGGGVAVSSGGVVPTRTVGSVSYTHLTLPTIYSV